MNLTTLFAIARQQHARKTALEFQHGARSRHWTYEELHRQAEAMAGCLHRQGVGFQDRVVVYAGNSDDFVIALLASWQLGAIMVPVNLRYRRHEMEHILSDCRPRLILADADNAAALQAMALAPSCLDSVSILCLEDMTAAAPAPDVRVASDDLALILYTSGTTGHSKGAMISHNNILATVTGLLNAWAWTAEDVLLLTLPLFHVHGLVVGLVCALAAGSTVILHPVFRAEPALALLGSGRPTLFFAVPTMYYRLLRILEQQPAINLAHMRLFCSGSAPLAAEDHRRFERLTGHVILERYGMTETGMNFSNPYAGPRLPGTVGLPLPGVSARIVDQAGQTVSPGEEGHVQVRGSNVISAYWRDPGTTAASFVHDTLGRRWFRTGDMGRLDPDTGYLTLLGRSRELILSGGFNVYPREVEEVLMQCSGVQEAAVIGHPDAEWGQVPLAYLVVDSAFCDTEAAAFCRRQLASFKVPAEFRLVPELPRNAMGKLQKFLLSQA